jgi:hypothetical protein
MSAGLGAVYQRIMVTMDENTQKQLAALEQKIDAIYQTTERTRKYLFWTLVITILVVVLPAIGLVFAIPSFIETYSSLGDIGSF